MIGYSLAPTLEYNVGVPLVSHNKQPYSIGACGGWDSYRVAVPEPYEVLRQCGNDVLGGQRS